MKVAKDRKYTDAFRTSAVSQVLEGGRRQAAVARSLEISVKTLANWVGKARSGKGLTKGVSVSGYFEAQRRPAGGSARQIANAATAARMAAIQKRHRGRYGRRRMHRELRNAGEVVNHKRVSKLMQEHGLQSSIRRRFRVVTTDSKHLYPIAQNVLARDFSADAPNRKWLTDITYVSTDEGWL